MKKTRDNSNRNNQRITGQHTYFEPMISHPMDDLGAIVEDGGDLKESVLISPLKKPEIKTHEKLINNLDNLI